MGVVSDNWFGRVSLSILYIVQTLMSTDVQTPVLGTPLVPLGKAGMSDEFARVFIPPGTAPDVAAALTQHIETFRIQIQQDSI